jgi:beta-galactosidase/beta-glucuronidase
VKKFILIIISLLIIIAVSTSLIIFILGKTAFSKFTVYIRKQKNNHYQLIVKGKPYIIKGVCYSPIPIGQDHDYDWWSDPNQPWIVDGKLMKNMGINTVRIYEPGANPEAVKRVIRDFYRLYGIRVILGSWLGYWQYPCPFYGDKKFQENVKKEVLDMVNLYKDEPGILLWVLGNENNYSCLGQVNPWPVEEVDKEADPQKQKALRAKIYYSFVNDISQSIHKIDTAHPVALGNGELIGLEYANKYCNDVDLVACIIYRGKTFGNLFNSIRATFDKPIILSEFGADAYDAYRKKEDQNMQGFFLESQWRQIYENIAGSKTGAGNALGGTIFEWSDEWWKHNEYDPESWKIHDTESNWSNGSYYFDIQAPGNKNMNEEWFGIVALSPEQKEFGLDKRIPRKAYYVIREFWKNPSLNNNKKKKTK